MDKKSMNWGQYNTRHLINHVTLKRSEYSMTVLSTGSARDNNFPRIKKSNRDAEFIEFVI